MANHLRLHLHLTWATRDRRPWLTHPVRLRLLPYMAATIRGQRGEVRALGQWINLVKARSTH